MSFALARLLLDFGLVVLIWLIQLVVYPSFRYYSREDLLRWHPRYTIRVTYVVLPLMVGQLSVAAVQLWQEISWYTTTSLVVIGLLWLSTFLQFVPLHNRIEGADFDADTLARLVRINWLRTAGWSLLMGLSVLHLT